MSLNNTYRCHWELAVFQVQFSEKRGVSSSLIKTLIGSLYRDPLRRSLFLDSWSRIWFSASEFTSRF
ncbi:hypothetical protein K7X08_034815 [Anisodus acutangulus]|uniref:Uncharacterized protein n=1 Tax=Anisodus acutangulus TaxID=402998 RepID=A0A9Q1R183_9SOLA|nr:hypothetical protein K7X08_034815 [Anisodus acutangulus]